MSLTTVCAKSKPEGRRYWTCIGTQSEERSEKELSAKFKRLFKEKREKRFVELCISFRDRKSQDLTATANDMYAALCLSFRLL